MEVRIDNILEFIFTSGIYIVIVVNLLKIVTKNLKKSQEEYNNPIKTERKANKLESKKDNFYNDEASIGMKKQSVFTSVMNQVNKISDKFETMENSWSKGLTLDSEYKNEKNSNVKDTISQNVIKTEVVSLKNTNDINNKIYQPIDEISDIKGDAYAFNSVVINAKKSELRKSIIMKEILDKPLAHRRLRR